MTVEIPPETEAKAQAAIDLEHELDVEECMWTMGLYPTEALIEKYNQLIKMTEELIPLVPVDKDPTELKRLIARYERKLKRFRKALKEGHH